MATSKEIIVSDPALQKAMHSPADNHEGYRHLSGRTTRPVEREKVIVTLPTLPEHLVENILAMVPFPHLFKARVLSKSWLARLSPISSQEDEEMKSLAITFQKKVGEYSTNWKTFSPVFVVMKNIFAFDQESQVCRKVPTPTVSFSPLPHLAIDPKYPPHLEGALLFFDSRSVSDLGPGDLSVANVLTRSWKELQARPSTDGAIICGPAALVSKKETYVVIELYKNSDGDSISFALIYDSGLRGWSRRRVEIAISHAGTGNHVCLNGVVYWLVGSRNWARSLTLWTFDVEEETFDLLKIQYNNEPRAQYVINEAKSLLICNGKMFVVLQSGHFIVLKIDPMSQTFVKTIEGPCATLDFSRFKISSHGDFIFFLERGCTKILAYNTEKDEWSVFCIPTELHRRYFTIGFGWASSFFQPGLNPFLAL